MNLTKEQIMKLKELYSKEIDKMAKKNDLKKSELNNKYKNALTIAIIVVSIVGALIGGTLVRTIIHKLLTAIYSNITLSGVSILSSLLGVVISNGFFVKFGIPKLKDLTGYSKGIKEYDGVSEICSSLKDKTRLDYIGFKNFINELASLFSSTEHKDIRDNEFIRELATKLDFFVGHQNRRKTDRLFNSETERRKNYKLNESFYQLLYDNLGDIKEIFGTLISEAREIDGNNVRMHQLSQKEMFTEMPRSFSNVPEYQEMFGDSISTNTYPIFHQNIFYPVDQQPARVVSMRHVVDQNIPIQATVRHSGFIGTINTINPSYQRKQ